MLIEGVLVIRNEIDLHFELQERYLFEFENLFSHQHQEFSGLMEVILIQKRQSLPMVIALAYYQSNRLIHLDHQNYISKVEFRHSFPSVIDYLSVDVLVFGLYNKNG